MQCATRIPPAKEIRIVEEELSNNKTGARIYLRFKCLDIACRIEALGMPLGIARHTDTEVMARCDKACQFIGIGKPIFRRFED